MSFCKFDLSPRCHKPILIWHNYAVAYNGENKDKVAQAHLSNRKILIDNKEITMTYATAGVK